MALLKRAQRDDTAANSTRIAELLEGYELPSFPRVITAAIQEVSAPDADLSSVADVLKEDPGLSVHLLRLVNSATFAPRRPIVDLHQAVMMLGRNQLESLLISLAVHKTLPAQNTAGFDAGRFWRMAATRATVAAGFANLVDPGRRSENFTAALLSDLAIPVLCHQVDGYGALLADAEDTVVHCAAEAERFGWTHQQVGQIMCETWEFPEQLSSAIGTHHDPLDASDTLPLVKVVAAVRDFDDAACQEAFAADVSHMFGLPIERCAEILAEALAEATATGAMFG